MENGNKNDRTKGGCGRRVRITNDRLNSYGTRVLTAGMDVGQYERNPVLLYMHERGNVIGYMKDVEKGDGEVTGEPVFDEASELSRRCKRQWEFGSLRMVSAGLDILELSADASLAVEGQTRETITRSRLTEVSVVDIGANDDAIVLKMGGERIELGREGECAIPLLEGHANGMRTGFEGHSETGTTPGTTTPGTTISTTTTSTTTSKLENEMEMKDVAKQLGLPETASADEIGKKLNALNAQGAELERLKKDHADMELRLLTAAVDAACTDGRVTEDKKDVFVALGKQVGADGLEKVLAALPRQKTASLMGQIQDQGAGAGTGYGQYKKLSDVPAEEMLKLKAEHPKEYMRLYKAEYGMEF